MLEREQRIELMAKRYLRGECIWTGKPMRNMFSIINDKTGFANGELFDDEEEIRSYFTVINMIAIFGNDAVLDQDELDEYADLVVENHWHMK